MNGLTICQTKYCKITFLALLCLVYLIFNRPVVGRATLLRQKFATNLLLFQNCN